MSTFCLVHGVAQGPAGWDLLVAELETQGHHSVPVDLPVDRPALSATAYAQLIATSLDNTSQPIVVAHSVSGLFLPLVPGYAQVAKLVYLAAVIPLPGESFVSQYQKDPAMYRPGFTGKDPTVDEALARHYMFHDCPPEVASWGLTTVRLMYAKQAIVEVCPLTKLPDVPCVYISCRQDRTINPDWWEQAARQRLRTEPIRLDAGHFPHVSQAAQLATLLDSIASRPL
jgi:pimeloyl-ACP methyl ester carboxylesterase